MQKTNIRPKPMMGNTMCYNYKTEDAHRRPHALTMWKVEETRQNEMGRGSKLSSPYARKHIPVCRPVSLPLTQSFVSSLRHHRMKWHLTIFVLCSYPQCYMNEIQKKKKCYMNGQRRQGLTHWIECTGESKKRQDGSKRQMLANSVESRLHRWLTIAVQHCSKLTLQRVGWGIPSPSTLEQQPHGLSSGGVTCLRWFPLE